MRENEAADTLSKIGYHVEQNPAVPGSKKPDYRIKKQYLKLMKIWMKYQKVVLKYLKNLKQRQFPKIIWSDDKEKTFS